MGCGYDLLKKIDSIDYTHLLGYPSEVVAAEVITMVKDVVSDHMDKIVGQLIANSCIVEDSDGHAGHVVFTETAIKIVKKGGNV